MGESGGAPVSRSSHPAFSSTTRKSANRYFPRDQCESACAEIMLKQEDERRACFNSVGSCGFLQCRDGIPDIRIKARATGVKMGEDRRAHPRVPEFADMLGYSRNRLAVALAVEELANLISHVDQPVRRHGRLLAWRPLT